MSELILHIGTRKTGTTALQLFFTYNCDLLSNNGIDYVQFTPQYKEPLTTKRNGGFLKRYCLALLLKEEISSQVSDFEENYKRLADALNGEKRVLLSDEDFSAITNLTFNKDLDPKEYWRILSREVDKLGARNTTLIVYLRRQDEYAISHWKEMVKDGYTNKSFHEYLSHPTIESELDYKKMLDTISNAFGSSAKIIVRSYNQVDSSLNGILYDFCDALEIPWDSNYKLPKRRINKALSFDMTEALRTCKYGLPGRSSKEERQMLKRLALVLSGKHSNTNDTTVFSPEEAKSLVTEYSDGNRRIAEEYCNNNSLFSGEFNEGPIWRPNRLRIAKYRAAFLCPKLSLKLCSISKNVKGMIKKVFNHK